MAETRCSLVYWCRPARLHAGPPVHVPYIVADSLAVQPKSRADDLVYETVEQYDFLVCGRCAEEFPEDVEAYRTELELGHLDEDEWPRPTPQRERGVPTP